MFLLLITFRGGAKTILLSDVNRYRAAREAKGRKGSDAAPSRLRHPRPPALEVAALEAVALKNV